MVFSSSTESIESLSTLVSSLSITAINDSPDMSANTPTVQGSLLVLKFDDKRVLIPRPRTYSLAIDAACRQFPCLSRTSAKLQTRELDVCEGHLVDITEESWPLVITLVNLIEVQETPPIEVTRPPPTWRSRPPPTAHPLPIGEMRVAKPVIYLYSPVDIDASVKLSLNPEWRFFVIYPVITPKQNGGERIEWNVRTHQNGNLTEKNTGLEVSYLFWEAEVNPGAPPSPPRSPAFGQLQQVECFNATSTDLTDTDSVVLSADKVTPYLDKSLRVLGLHTEARTSFITYWLPSIQKHRYIALRFIPQAAYERAAPLDISPQPDIITRVFMIFKGIGEDQLANWSGAQARAENDVTWWTDVVGVELERAMDASLFRVLEWGGMEVVRA